jgi:hypothetical protein
MSLKKSLKTIRKSIVQKNTIFRTIRHVYTHLDDLSNEEILDYYGLGTIQELENHVEKIKVILLNCEINNNSIETLDSCFCMDSRKEFKYLYSSKKDAERQIAFSRQHKGIKLKLYACPYHCGWHLAKT